jgi:hypothetical protein
MSTLLFHTKLDEQFIETNNLLENEEEGQPANVFYTPKAQSTLSPQQIKTFYEHLYKVANKLKIQR